MRNAQDGTTAYGVSVRVRPFLLAIAKVRVTRRDEEVRATVVHSEASLAKLAVLPAREFMRRQAGARPKIDPGFFAAAVGSTARAFLLHSGSDDLYDRRVRFGIANALLGGDMVARAVQELWSTAVWMGGGTWLRYIDVDAARREIVDANPTDARLVAGLRARFGRIPPTRSWPSDRKGRAIAYAVLAEAVGAAIVAARSK
jgi:hypothetical protein